jgi:hypothetical protein
MKRYTSNFSYQPRAGTSGKGASPAHGAVDFLRTHDRMATLLPAVVRMAELQKQCSALLPESFHVCTVVQFEAGCLVFSAPHAALAAKLKQRMPKLQEALLNRGWQVDAIRVKISVSPSYAVQPVSRKEKHLPRHALSALSDLEQGLEASPRNAALKAAIQTMLERHQAAQKK